MKITKVILIGLLVILQSCSSMKKTILYSTLTGAVVGGASGYALSPDKESQGANTAVFGLIGGVVTGLIGYVLFKDDPRNKKLNHMLLDKDKKIDPNKIDIGFNNFNINADLKKQEAYKVPVKNLPPKLRGKVKQQFVIKYTSKERYVQKGEKTFYIPAFEVYEHSYDQLGKSKGEN